MYNEFGRRPVGLKRQAKILSKGQTDAVLAYLTSTRYPERNRAICLTVASRACPVKPPVPRKANQDRREERVRSSRSVKLKPDRHRDRSRCAPRTSATGNHVPVLQMAFSGGNLGNIGASAVIAWGQSGHKKFRRGGVMSGSGSG